MRLFPIAETDDERRDVVRRYVDREITAEEAADRFGPGTAIVDVILEAKRRFGRLPDRRDAFADGEYQRALIVLGLAGERTASKTGASAVGGTATVRTPR